MSMKFVSKLKGFADSVKDDLARRMLENSVYSNRILFLSTLAQSPLPAGDFRKPVSGADIENAAGGYVELYRNDSSHPVALTVYGYLMGASGQQVKISLRADRKTNAIIDYLSSSVSAPAWAVKRVSDVIILKPKQSVYLADANWDFSHSSSQFPLTDADKFVPRVFDLADYVVDQSWE